MSRVLCLVLDSLGIGALPDAADYGDAGADTLGHIAAWCARPLAQGGRGRVLALPQLRLAGLGHAYALVHGEQPAGWQAEGVPQWFWGAAREQSRGKDTVSGHWEMMGLPVPWDWGYFSAPVESFPAELIAALAAAAGTAGVLGRCHASGTTIIEQLGAAHEDSGWPIVYTSADSVLQIAAHEQHFGRERLYALCAQARALVDRWRIGRVIARPFLGDRDHGYVRTTGRRDYAVPPSAPTLLDRLCADGGQVIAIGKIHDIFAGRGISQSVSAYGIDGLIDASLAALRVAPARTLVYTNLVDFDQEYGHRRDVAGYAQALEGFDARLPELIAALGPEDVLVLTADHGNDPSWHGSDHTREHVPLLLHSPARGGGTLGVRDSFADLAQTLAGTFGLPPLAHGLAFAWS